MCYNYIRFSILICLFFVQRRETVKTAGIIAEYNPFHNGHEYHIQKTREKSGADGIIAVMSGNFVQRGDAALCDKYSRAKAAVLGGADLVAELPCFFACQSAEFFAKGGVEILEAMKCDYISFGTETDDISELIKLADTIKSSGPDFGKRLSEELKSGVSFPKAMANVIGSDLLNTPNNVLAVEYLKAVKSMTPLCVKRYGSQHDGEGSASFIRQRISEGKSIEKFVPRSTYKILESSDFADRKILESLILYKLHTVTEEELKKVPDVTEGLEHRIIDCAKKCTSLEQLCGMIKTKRYTMARIRRIMINALLGITAEDLKQPPQYIRVLGMNDTGKKILADLRGKTDIPIITKTADAEKCRMLETDIAASNIYSVLTGQPAMSDYKKSPVII